MFDLEALPAVAGVCRDEDAPSEPRCGECLLCRAEAAEARAAEAERERDELRQTLENLRPYALAYMEQSAAEHVEAMTEHLTPKHPQDEDSG